MDLLRLTKLPIYLFGISCVVMGVGIGIIAGSSYSLIADNMNVMYTGFAILSLGTIFNIIVQIKYKSELSRKIL